MDGENRRSREAVRNSIRTYGVKVMDPASLLLKKTTERESQESVSRFSEKSLHKDYRRRKGWMNRVPYATIVATTICLLGILIAGVGFSRFCEFTKNMFQDVFHTSGVLYDALSIIFILFEVLTVVIIVIILVLAFLLTGGTRTKLIKGRKSRTAGWVLSILFMISTVFLLFCWILFFGLTCTFMLLLMTGTTECTLRESGKCMHLTILNAFFLRDLRFFNVCKDLMVKKFCKDYLEKVAPSIISLELSTCFVIIGLAMLLACLASNYTMVRHEVKMQELEDQRRPNNTNQGSTGRM